MYCYTINILVVGNYVQIMVTLNYTYSHTLNYIPFGLKKERKQIVAYFYLSKYCVKQTIVKGCSSEFFPDTFILIINNEFMPFLLP